MYEPYHITVVFPNEAHAQHAYHQLCALLEELPCELSAYRFQFQSRWYISVLGTRPSPPLQAQLEGLLTAAAGKATALPEGLYAQLVQRRYERVQNGRPWQQQHHPGGLRFPFRGRRRK
ncbi:MAG: hypothetical protein J2P37_23680 [Ktedonobacteraceae bacterium]|nr:hypothetical protein [Ktedonobacteraceae bacterium]